MYGMDRDSETQMIISSFLSINILCSDREHPERPERAERIWEYLKKNNIVDRATVLQVYFVLYHMSPTYCTLGLIFDYLGVKLIMSQKQM